MVRIFLYVSQKPYHGAIWYYYGSLVVKLQIANRLTFEKWNYSRDFISKYVIFGSNGKLKNRSYFCRKNSVLCHSLEPQFLRHKIAYDLISSTVSGGIWNRK